MSNTAGRVDYNRAKIAAYVVVAGFMALMLVFGIRSMSGPNLADGDRVESMTCPLCKGTGTATGSDKRCPACLGVKKLKAVIPGPNHPVDLRGTVRDLRAFKDQSEADRVAATDAKDHRVSLTPVKGAVADAKVVFDGPSGRTDFTSKATGRFWGVIVPGEYKLSVSKDGFAKKEQAFTVKPLTNPIWPDVAGMEPSADLIQLDIFLSPGS